MRIKYSSRDELVIFHGPVEMNLAFAEVVSQIKHFMAASPKETIILIFQGMEQRTKQG
jgi:hypothetical protein